MLQDSGHRLVISYDIPGTPATITPNLNIP
jgi:hypothetical protein